MPPAWSSLSLPPAADSSHASLTICRALSQSHSGFFVLALTSVRFLPDSPSSRANGSRLVLDFRFPRRICFMYDGLEWLVAELCSRKKGPKSQMRNGRNAGMHAQMKATVNSTWLLTTSYMVSASSRDSTECNYSRPDVDGDHVVRNISISVVHEDNDALQSYNADHTWDSPYTKHHA